MKVSVLFVLLFAFLISAEVVQENGVYVLDDASWDSWIAEKQNILVEFYAPWCGHCKSLTPEYEAAAQALGKSAFLVKVDATQNNILATKFGIQGFPTLFWFPSGDVTPISYTGGRTSSTIQSWIKRQIVTDLNILSSQAEFDTFTQKRDEGIFASIVQIGGDTDPYLLQLSKDSEYINFARVASGSNFGGKEGTFVLYRNHGDVVSTTPLEPQQLINWINEHAYPIVTEFSQGAIQRLGDRDFVIIAVDSYANGNKEELINILTTAAEGKPGLGWLYADSAVLGRAVESVGASGKVYPTCVAVNFKTGQQLAFNEENKFNIENLNSWVSGLYTGETKPFKKSEPIPESNNGPVTILVQKNFDELISSKPAFVKYYAPWCGHCKTLAPIWEQLGEALKNENVLIAKLDATVNYIDYEVRGYPTLVWYENGVGSNYEGERDLESLKSFVQSKLSHTHEEL